MPRPRILVVEDDASILLGLQVNLEAEGYTVDTAVDGAKGLEKARQGWDLVIVGLSGCLGARRPGLGVMQGAGSLMRRSVPEVACVRATRPAAPGGRDRSR